MTMTDTTPSTRRNGGRTANADGPPLTDQVVLSGAGVVTHGIAGVRRVADGMLAAADAAIGGLLDAADTIVASDLGRDVARQGIEAARRSWSETAMALRQALLDL